MEKQLEEEARIGEEIVQNLPRRFLEENHGRYLAITFTGNILTLTDSLEELNDQLANMELNENYYMCRIGHPTFTEINMIDFDRNER